MNTPYTCRIYWEDTDAGGIVYNANYHKFAERARTEWLRALGYSQRSLQQKTGGIFVIKRCTIDYISPAFLDDILTVTVALEKLTAVRLQLSQHMTRDNKPIAHLEVELCYIDNSGKPMRIPAQLAKDLAAKLGSGHDPV